MFLFLVLMLVLISPQYTLAFSVLMFALTLVLISLVHACGFNIPFVHFDLVISSHIPQP